MQVHYLHHKIIKIPFEGYLFYIYIYTSIYFFLGQLISDQVAEIVSKYDPNVYSIKYNNQLATRTAQAIFDDSYLGR